MIDNQQILQPNLSWCLRFQTDQQEVMGACGDCSNGSVQYVMLPTRVFDDGSQTCFLGGKKMTFHTGFQLQGEKCSRCCNASLIHREGGQESCELQLVGFCSLDLLLILFSVLHFLYFQIWFLIIEMVQKSCTR